MTEPENAPKSRMPELTEEEISFLENCIPQLAAAATSAAYWRTLASGLSVLIVEGDAIFEVFPNGRKTLIKNLPPRAKATIGETYELK